jgi:hypothetical protein
MSAAIIYANGEVPRNSLMGGNRPKNISYEDLLIERYLENMQAE